MDSSDQAKRALAEDASGRPFADLLLLAATMLEERGGGPVADCLRLKAEDVAAALSPEEQPVIGNERELSEVQIMAIGQVVADHLGGHLVQTGFDETRGSVEIYVQMGPSHRVERYVIYPDGQVSLYP